MELTGLTTEDYKALIRNLQLAAEGYQGLARTYERALDEVNHKLMDLEQLSIRQNDKIQRLTKALSELSFQRPSLRTSIYD